MALFQGCSVLFELRGLPFKEKQKIKLAVTDNGGLISFVVNKECSLIVTSDVSSLSHGRLRNIVKHQIPVVGLDYVHRCVEADCRLALEDFQLDISSTMNQPSSIKSAKDKWSGSTFSTKPSKSQNKPLAAVSTKQSVASPKGKGSVLDFYRLYKETDSDLPKFPENFQVAKYGVFQRDDGRCWSVLELQSAKDERRRKYRVVRYWMDDVLAKKPAVRDHMMFMSTSEEALKVFQLLADAVRAAGLNQEHLGLPQALEIGSAPLHELLLEERLHTEALAPDVGDFVELLWTEALGCTDRILNSPVHKISLNDVTRAEGILLQLQRRIMQNNNDNFELQSEYFTLLPQKVFVGLNISSISKQFDLCQLIRDILNVSEMTLGSTVPSSLGKYRALRCSIENVPRGDSEFEAVTSLLQHSKAQVHQILRVNRAPELQSFKSDLGGIKTLLHSSKPHNFVGILSRGLLMPCVAVSHHGIQRTDAGDLGSGIYFSDDINTTWKFSQCSQTDGSRLILVCEVALGRCKDLHNKDQTLTQAPEGHDSVHGVRNTPGRQSEFTDDEYVVYSPDQVKIKYVVRLSLEGEKLKTFTPKIVQSEKQPLSSPPNQGEGEIEDGIADIKNPLDNVTAGLLNSSGQQIPLQAVHVKCKLVDLLAQVIIFQKYTNESSAPIEAKYVFPLDDSAAVCGFEAFINGKHVVGQVKEKEAARREYKQAVEKGHGAYLMDQDAPDVFTISVGNLPAGATVLIKVTFVSELIVKDGSIFFSLPSSVAPWQESAALNQTTQATVKKVCVTDEEANSRDFNLDMSVEMPHKITDVKCITHQIKIKKTDCKAVVRVLPGEVMGPEGFQLLVTLTEVHVPRMWVEKHPDKDSQACMLVFYPNFDTTSPGTADEVVLLLDASQSMKGESLNTARTIALQILKTLENNVPVNVIFFGTDHKDAFISAKPINEARQEAKNFIKNFSSVGGSTELWRPLRALSLLPPSSGTRNLLLLSDGHIQNPEVTLKLLRDNTTHTRLFTCGLSATANRHMLRAMAQAGGGAYEFFDSKSKHTWSEKVAAQVKRMQAPGASSVSVKWQQFNPTAPAPVQAPKQLHALFNNCHTLVFGFVPHCTKATLLGKLSGQEIETMVSTSELQKTKGTFLHKLTARAIIRDFEDGSLDSNAVVHEEKKVELKSFVIELSKEFSILSQFTSFVAIEERDSEEEKGFTDVPKLIAEEDVDFLPYMSWASEDDSSDRSSSPDYDSEDSDFDYKLETCSLSPETKEGPVEEEDEEEMDEWISDEDMGLSLFDDDTTESASREMQKESSLAFTAMECEDDFSDVPTILKSDQKSKKLKLKLRKSALLESDCLMSAHRSPMEVELVFPKLKKARKDLIKDYDKSYQPPPPPPPPAGRISVAPGTVGSGLMMGKKMSSAPAPSFPPPVVGLSASPSQQIGFLRSTAVDLSPESLPETDQAYSHCPLSFPLAASLTPQQDYTLSESQFPSSPSYVPTSPSFSLPPFKGMETPAAPPSFSFGSAAGQPKPLSFESFSVEPVQYFVPPHRMSVSSQPAPPVKAKLDIFPSQEQTAASLLSFPFGSSLVEAKNEKAGVIREMEKAPRVTRGRPVMQCGFFPLQSEMKQGSELQPKPLHAAQRGSGHFLAKLVSQCADQEMQGSAIRRSGMRFGHSLDTRESKWPKIYSLQHQDGYWEITPELGMLLNCDISRFAEDFLKRKGIVSLGKKAHTEILRLLATLLVLQLMRLEKLREGQLLRTLFCLEESKFRPVRWAAVNRAVEWARWADREYPCVYSRLEFGLSWDSSTKQLLGAERFHQCSPLIGLNLNPRPTVIL